MSKSNQPAICIAVTVVVPIVLAVGNSAMAFTCGPGHYRGASRCEPCPKGRYISDLNHTSIDCIQCYLAEDFNHEYEAEKCSSTRDTQILCFKNYYRLDDPHETALGECKPCSICGVGKAEKKTFLIKPCDNYNDTQCCESSEFEQLGFDTSGQPIFQCVNSSADIGRHATSAPNSSNTIETVSKSSQKTRNLPSAGRKLTSTDSSVLFGLIIIFMFYWHRAVLTDNSL